MTSNKTCSCWEWLAPVGLGMVLLGSYYLFPRVPQNPDYHNFGDTRTVLGIPHFWNVVSNFLFLVAGVTGLLLLARGRLVIDAEIRPVAFLTFLGIALTAFGSAYYHLHPTNETLLWDRLPMTLAFMALLAGDVGERTRPRVGTLVLGPLLLLGVGSVLVWYLGDPPGSGNLLPYMVGQGYALAFILLLLFVTKPRFTRGYDYVIALAWYVLAKVLEDQDRWVHDQIGAVGGHPLKHIAAGMGTLWIVRMLLLRKKL